jgi:hypothetical protein
LHLAKTAAGNPGNDIIHGDEEEVGPEPLSTDDPPRLRASRLSYVDERLAELDLPGGRLVVTRGLGSGLAGGGAGDPETLWSVGDRGPNLKVAIAVDRYGVAGLAPLRVIDGAKILPCPDIGPAISELRLSGDHIALVRSLAIRGRSGRPISGLPPLYGASEEIEPAFGIDGTPLPPDPSGADTEGIAVAPDGDFWIGDEYGPSLLQVAPDGTVRRRLVPAGTESWFAGADYPIEATLPAIAQFRRLNRGFEGLALSPDGAWLYLAFQSPLAHPDAAAHRRGRHVRIWKLATATGTVDAQFVYPLDRPKSFRRDGAQGDIDRSDVKLSEMAMLEDDRLILLERGSLTTKLYAVRLDADRAIDPIHLDAATRPTIEQMSADGDLDRHVPILAKRLIVSTDDHPEIDGDMEGVALLTSRSLILVNDNDFGIEGTRTRFWRLDFDGDL